MGFKQWLKVLFSTLIILLFIIIAVMVYVDRKKIPGYIAKMKSTLMGKREKVEKSSHSLSGKPDTELQTSPEEKTQIPAKTENKTARSDIPEKGVKIVDLQKPSNSKEQNTVEIQNKRSQNDDFSFMDQTPEELQKNKQKQQVLAVNKVDEKIDTSNNLDVPKPSGSDAKKRITRKSRKRSKVGKRKRTYRKRSTRVRSKRRSSSKLERRVMRLERQLGIKSSGRLPLHKRVYRLEKIMLKRGRNR